jgi:hypothetical protein
MEFALNQGFLVTEGRFPIRYKDRTKSYLCRVTFDLTRAHNFVIDCLESVHDIYSGFSSAGFFPAEPFFLEPTPGAKPIECICGNVSQELIGNDPGLRVTLYPRGDCLVDRGLPLERLNAGIVNFYQYRFGPPNRAAFRLEDRTWVFEFTPVGDATVSYPSQIQNESYLFSHHLLLRTRSGESFSCAEAQRATDMLSTFLSFCAEHWVAPALVVGLDESGAVAMEEWNDRLLDPRHEPHNWLDRHHGNAMVEVFPGFSRLMQDPMWREAIRTAVYWYVRADTNHVGPDGAIVLVQAALERLAWHVLVQDRHAISENGFSKLEASDTFRLLFDACSIPLRIPATLPQLSIASKGKKAEQNWVDGPQAFVAVRNQIVHPQKRKRIKGGHAYYEALQLDKWYLELVLLRSFGFNGQYSNRLRIQDRWAGEVEAVPWASV